MTGTSQRIKTTQDLLYELLYVVFKWKILICIVFFTMLIGKIGGAYIITPQWKATTKLLVQQNPRLQPVFFKTLVQPGESGQRLRPSAIVVEMLTGQDMAQEVVKAFQLDKRLYEEENNPVKTADVIKYQLKKFTSDYPKSILIKLGLLEEKKKDYFARATKKFMDDWVDISVSADTDIVSVRVWGETPELATNICRFMVERAIAKKLELTKMNISNALLFVENQMPVVAENLLKAEENLMAFKQKKSIVKLDEEINIKMTHISRAQEEISRLKPDLSSLLTEKAANHPEILSLENKIRAIKHHLNNNLLNDLRKLSEEKMEYDILTRNKEITETLYKNFQTQFKELQILTKTIISEFNIRIIDHAYVPETDSPHWPRWDIIIPVIVLVALIVAFITPFFFEFFSDSVRFQEIEEFLDKPVSGEIIRV